MKRNRRMISYDKWGSRSWWFSVREKLMEVLGTASDGLRLNEWVDKAMRLSFPGRNCGPDRQDLYGAIGNLLQRREVHRVKRGEKRVRMIGGESAETDDANGPAPT